MHVRGANFGPCTFVGLVSPTTSHVGQDEGSFVVDLKKDSKCSTHKPSSIHKAISSGSLLVSFGRGPYLLKPWVIVQGWAPSWGLGFDVLKEYGHGKVGCKWTLKHAQERASREVSQGRQRLISSILKTGIALKAGSP